MSRAVIRLWFVKTQTHMKLSLLHRQLEGVCVCARACVTERGSSGL